MAQVKPGNKLNGTMEIKSNQQTITINESERAQKDE